MLRQLRGESEHVSDTGKRAGCTRAIVQRRGLTLSDAKDSDESAALCTDTLGHGNTWRA